MTKNILLLLLATNTIALSQRSKPTWERVSRHDANKDGKVSKLEFKGPDQAFTRFDSNKDGSITEEEMKNVTGKSGKGGKAGKPDNAPAVGTVAPQLNAQKLGSKEMVDLGKIKKTTVLIFGSYT